MSTSRPDLTANQVVLLAELDQLGTYLQRISMEPHPLLNASGFPVEGADGSWLPELEIDLQVIAMRLEVYDRRAAILDPDPLPARPDSPGGM